MWKLFKTHHGVEDWYQCRKMCNEETDCKYFTFKVSLYIESKLDFLTLFFHNQNLNICQNQRKAKKRQCNLFGIFYKEKKGYVSGRKYCKEEKSNTI